MKTTKQLLGRIILTAIAINLFTATLQAQDTGKPSREFMSYGAGFGLDYAGLGVGLNFYPQKNIGIMLNGGVFVAGPSYKVGLILRHITRSKVDPYVSFLYGYSGGVCVIDEDGYDKIYIRPNIGAGIDIHFTKHLCLSTGLSTNTAYSDINDYMDELEDEIGADFSGSIILPVGVSVGIKYTVGR